LNAAGSAAAAAGTGKDMAGSMSALEVSLNVLKLCRLLSGSAGGADTAAAAAAAAAGGCVSHRWLVLAGRGLVACWQAVEVRLMRKVQSCKAVHLATQCHTQHCNVLHRTVLYCTAVLCHVMYSM
jgi:hypothetical protein